MDNDNILNKSLLKKMSLMPKESEIMPLGNLDEKSIIHPI